MYACIFPLPQARDCSDPNIAACDCTDPKNDNPLCADNGTKGRTLQTHAKAYPGIRELTLVKSLGSQGIVGSICPKQLNDLNAPDFGYRPAIGAIIDRLKQALGGQCLSRTLTADEKGQVPCLILEASKVDDSKVADCNKCGAAGRDPVSGEQQNAVDAIKADNPAAGYNCFCEISQLENDKADVTQSQCKSNYDQAGYDLCACQYTPPEQAVPNGVDGWCYIDATSGIGEPKIVDKCAESEKRLIRFVNKGQAAAGATLFITCTGDTASN
jgi:hypothetical protein